MRRARYDTKSNKIKTTSGHPGDIVSFIEDTHRKTPHKYTSADSLMEKIGVSPPGRPAGGGVVNATPHHTTTSGVSPPGRPAGGGVVNATPHHTTTSAEDYLATHGDRSNP